DAACDKERRRSVRLDEEASDDGRDRSQEERAERVDASDAPQELARDVALHRGIPQRAEAGEREADARRTDEREWKDREEPKAGDRERADDREDVHGDSGPMDTNLADKDAADHLT